MPEEFDAAGRKAVVTCRRKTHLAFIREVNLFLENQRQELGRIVSELEREGRPFTVRDVTSAYRQRYDDRYVHTFFRHQIEDLRKAGALGTANKYKATLVAFEKFSGLQRVDFDSVDENMVLDFERYLRQIPLSPNTVAFYLSNFRAVYNKAQKRGYVSHDRSPFRAVPVHIRKTRKLAVSAEIIRRVASAEFPDSDKLNRARDLFMFSFYTRGMSFVDMAYLRQEDVRDGFIRYRRRKTGQVYTVRIIPEVDTSVNGQGEDRPGDADQRPGTGEQEDGQGNRSPWQHPDQRGRGRHQARHHDGTVAAFLRGMQGAMGHYAVANLHPSRRGTLRNARRRNLMEAQLPRPYRVGLDGLRHGKVLQTLAAGHERNADHWPKRSTWNAARRKS